MRTHSGAKKRLKVLSSGKVKKKKHSHASLELSHEL
ncbi:50S ribosomal protein L35 [Bdellovibrio bacteriovorus]